MSWKAKVTVKKTKKTNIVSLNHREGFRARSGMTPVVVELALFKRPRFTPYGALAVP